MCPYDIIIIDIRSSDSTLISNITLAVDSFTYLWEIMEDYMLHVVTASYSFRSC